MSMHSCGRAMRSPGIWSTTRLRSTIVAVAWLDRSPKWRPWWTDSNGPPDGFARRRRAAGSLADPALWTVDPDFDLAWHVRRVTSPPPTLAGHGDRDGRGDVRLPTHPLWEFTLVDNLADGGVASRTIPSHRWNRGMQLLFALFDPARDPPHQGGLPNLRSQQAEQPSSCPCSVIHWSPQGVGLRPGIRWLGSSPRCGEVVDTPSGASRRSGDDAICRPHRARYRAHSRSHDLLQPGDLRLSMLEVSLDDLQVDPQWGEDLSTTVLMAAVTGGFRQYHGRHAHLVDELRVTLPISTRVPGTPPVGTGSPWHVSRDRRSRRPSGPDQGHRAAVPGRSQRAVGSSLQHHRRGTQPASSERGRST